MLSLVAWVGSAFALGQEVILDNSWWEWDGYWRSQLFLGLAAMGLLCQTLATKADQRKYPPPVNLWMWAVIGCISTVRVTSGDWFAGNSSLTGLGTTWGSFIHPRLHLWPSWLWLEWTGRFNSCSQPQMLFALSLGIVFTHLVTTKTDFPRQLLRMKVNLKRPDWIWSRTHAGACRCYAVATWNASVWIQAEFDQQLSLWLIGTEDCLETCGSRKVRLIDLKLKAMLLGQMVRRNVNPHVNLPMLSHFQLDSNIGFDALPNWPHQKWGFTLLHIQGGVPKDEGLDRWPIHQLGRHSSVQSL